MKNKIIILILFLLTMVSCIVGDSIVGKIKEKPAYNGDIYVSYCITQNIDGKKKTVCELEEYILKEDIDSVMPIRIACIIYKLEKEARANNLKYKIVIDTY